jgi:hypothetical protein
VGVFIKCVPLIEGIYLERLLLSFLSSFWLQVPPPLLRHLTNHDEPSFLLVFLLFVQQVKFADWGWIQIIRKLKIVYSFPLFKFGLATYCTHCVSQMLSMDNGHIYRRQRMMPSPVLGIMGGGGV